MKQRTDEWMRTRKGRITASNVGAILGVAPYATRADVMRRMVRDYHGAESEVSSNVATEYGTGNEHGALIDFRLETGEDVQEVGFITREDWAGCSPDGLIGDDAGLEIKCPFGKRKDAKPEFKSIIEQPHYYAQVQFSLWVTGRKRWAFYQWAPGGTSLEEVPVSVEWQDENLPLLRQFYAEYLDAIKDPGEYLAPLRKEIDGIKASMLLREYDEMAEAEERAKERKSAILNELVEMADGKNAEICGRKLTHIEKAGAVSYAKAIKDLCPGADLDPYRGKPSSYWRLG